MSGDLKWNKIAGAGLATVFTILIVNEVASRVYHQEAPEKMGYFIEVAEEETGGEVELPTDWGTVLPVADLGAGEAAFARCATCHTITQGGANGTGPNLWGTVGGPVTHAAGFNYSSAMQAHAAAVGTWTYDELDAFIENPARHVSGTNMTFGGLRDQTARANLIAWMREQGSSGYAIPAPDPARQPGAADGEVPAEGEAGGADDLPGGTEVEGVQGAEPVEDPGARGGQAADTPNMDLSNPGGPDNRAGRGG